MEAPYEPYDTDISLFKMLGLKPFEAPHNKEIHVGTVRIETSLVDLWVTACPAQFWRFEIKQDHAEHKTVLETGSGALSEFWPMILMFAEERVMAENVSINLTSLKIEDILK